jgi:hypothetical protein
MWLLCDDGTLIMRDVAAPETLRFFLTPREWRHSLLYAGVAAALTAVGTYDLSIWITSTVFLTVLTACHMKGASRFMVPLPHLAILISALQYVLAAWWLIYVPGSIVTPYSLAFYLSYAGPVMIAVAVGWTVALMRMRPWPERQLQATPGLLRELDWLLVIGLAAIPLGNIIRAPALAFAFVLLGNLRYIGVFGRMILRERGWQLRLAVVLTAEFVFAADAAMFHPLLLWAAWSFAVWLYCFKPPARVLVTAFVAAALLLPSFQEAKWRLRGQMLEFDPESGFLSESGEEGSSMFVKATSFFVYLAEGLVHSVRLNFTPDFVADTLLRYNQGWIVTNVMIFVPDREPYAMGETLKNAVMASLVPRLVDPQKVRAGGRENMAQYAGMYLDDKTSMNLGYAGEMYANFGRWGVLACGAYAFVFGIFFRFLARRAFSLPMWWSVVPFIFFAVLKAEDGVAEILNWTSKSGFVLLGVILVFPNLRRSLSSRQTDDEEQQRQASARIQSPEASY